MSDTTCPTAAELDRAFGSAAPELVAHVASCPTCTAVWTETAEAIALVRELPAELPPASHCEEQRTALLAAYEHRPTAVRGRRWLVPAAFTAAAASVLLALWPHAAHAPAPPPPAPAPTSAHVVHPHAGAHYTIAAEAPDEIVRLREGTIDVDVRPLRPGERFRVIVGADQLEVHGTSFEVVAAGDRLVSVHVVHGRVEVRRVGSAPAFVAGGQSWHAIAAVAGPPAPARTPPRVEHAPPPAARVVERAPAPPELPRSAAPGPGPQETAFVTGWDAMRRGELAVAADAFARAVALDPHGDLAEDGTFWHAVAVARLHRSEEAIVALRGFIGTYPASTRAGEASVMLGWLLVDRNQLDEARLRFQSAIHDPSESVQTSARAGLTALDRARPR